VFAADIARQCQLDLQQRTGAMVMVADADSMEVDGEDSTWQEGYIALSISEDRSSVVSVFAGPSVTYELHASQNLDCVMSDAHACVTACRRAWSAAGCCQGLGGGHHTSTLCCKHIAATAPFWCIRSCLCVC
jgi:hypothetical protein